MKTAFKRLTTVLVAASAIAAAGSGVASADPHPNMYTDTGSPDTVCSVYTKVDGTTVGYCY